MGAALWMASAARAFVFASLLLIRFCCPCVSPCSGNWVNGVRSGDGAFVSGKDDSQLVGTWVNGEITRGKWLFADGTTWHGAFKKNKPIGPGVFYFTNGLQQEVRAAAARCLRWAFTVGCCLRGAAVA